MLFDDVLLYYIVLRCYSLKSWGKRTKTKRIKTVNDMRWKNLRLPGNQVEKGKPPSRFGDDDVTPEKVPVPGQPTPRKSRRSKDISPPPLKHRQNRMPEQVELVKDCK